MKKRNMNNKSLGKGSIELERDCRVNNGGVMESAKLNIPLS